MTPTFDPPINHQMSRFFSSYFAIRTFASLNGESPERGGKYAFLFLLLKRKFNHVWLVGGLVLCLHLKSAVGSISQHGIQYANLGS